MSQKDKSGRPILDPAQFVNEEKLLNWLNVNSKQLTSIRQRGFPYIQVANKARMYYLPSVVEWLKSRERNKG